MAADIRLSSLHSSGFIIFVPGFDYDSDFVLKQEGPGLREILGFSQGRVRRPGSAKRLSR